MVKNESSPHKTSLLEKISEFAQKIKPEQKAKFIILRDKQTGNIREVCIINYRQQVMSPIRSLIDSMNRLLNPMYRGEESFTPITVDTGPEAYDSSGIGRIYDVERIMANALPAFVEMNSLRQRIDPFYLKPKRK